LRANIGSRFIARIPSKGMQLCAVAKQGFGCFAPGGTMTWLALLHGKDKRIETDHYETDNLVRKASFCRASKLIRTFNAHLRRRHRLSRIDHASFTFFFIWRWLSGPRVYPSSRTIGSGRKSRGGCAHIGSWARVFLFDKRGTGQRTAQPRPRCGSCRRPLLVVPVSYS
jgi:hypothetical protein